MPATTSTRIQAVELADAMTAHGTSDLAELIALLRSHEKRGCHDCGHEVLWTVAAELAGHRSPPLRPVRQATLAVLTDRLNHPDPFGGFPT